MPKSNSYRRLHNERERKKKENRKTQWNCEKNELIWYHCGRNDSATTTWLILLKISKEPKNLVCLHKRFSSSCQRSTASQQCNSPPTLPLLTQTQPKSSLSTQHKEKKQHRGTQTRNKLHEGITAYVRFARLARTGQKKKSPQAIQL